MSITDAGAGILSGDDALMRIYLNNQRFGDDMLVSWDVKARTKIFEDDYGGNKTSGLDVRLYGWDLSVKTNYKTNRLLEAVLAYYQSKRVAGSAPVNCGILIAIQERTTASLLVGYQFTPVVFGYGMGMPGMKERLAQNLDCKARYMNPATAPK